MSRLTQHHSRFGSLAGLLVLLGWLSPGGSLAATYYTGGGPNDSVSCTSLSNPAAATNPSLRRATVNGGIACLGGSDTLIVAMGTYDECLTNNGGNGTAPIPAGSSWDAPTRIQAASGASVWLRTPSYCKPGDQGGYSTIELVGDVDAYMFFDGINIDNLDINGYCTGTTGPRHIVFQNAETRGSGWSACHQGGGGPSDEKFGPPAPGPGDVTYRNLSVHHCGLNVPPDPGAHCYYLLSGPWVIEGGDVHTAKSFGIQTTSEARNGSGTIRGVHVHDLRKGMVIAPGVTVYNNLFTNLSEQGVWLGGDVTVYNNTFYNCGTSCLLSQGSGGFTYRNNIFLGAGTATDGGSPSVSTPNLCASTSGTTYLGCTLTGTPSSVWVNPAAGDFRLAPGSPAKDAGVTISGFTTDMTGLTRQPPWDMGACEAGVASCSAGATTPADPTPASLAFGYAGSGHPSHTVAGATMAPVHVRVMDGTGTLLPSSTIPVTLALDLNPTSGTLSGTLTRNAGGVHPGVATFDNLSMTAIGTGYTLRATSTAPGPCAGTVCPDGSDYFNILATGAAALTPPIKVDQFGYLPTSTKVAVLSDPQTGFNAADTYTPGSLAVTTSPGGTTVFTGTATPWNAGATHAQSGDRLWWFDFSSVTTPGTYVIVDATNSLTSDVFTIGGNVYDAVLTAALRMFYYQRSGLAKVAPTYTDAKWADGAAFLGAGQDTVARSVVDQGNPATAKDVRGGWFDAGDYNKYVPWGAQTVNDLLTAYQQAPTLWSDAIGIPESGNGLPDIIDEAKWELDWLLRMQSAGPGGGAVLSKVSVLLTEATSPPSADTRPRYWGAASTAATAASAAAFAQGAIVFGTMGPTWATYTTTLSAAAQNAWTWLTANPNVTYPNTGFATANPDPIPCHSAPTGANCAYWLLMERLRAAVYLYALTGTAEYKTFVEANYMTAHALEWGYWYYSEAYIQDALLYYAALPGATLAVKNNIQNAAVGSIAGDDFVTAWDGNVDGYRAYLKDDDYTFGSNRNKASQAALYTNLLKHTLGTQPSKYRSIAESYLHYFHGVNPLGMAYLSRMGGLGAERSVTEMYHSWFADGTVWDNALTSPNGPPPGFLTSGPTHQYDGTASPPLGQPLQKIYKDWNGLATGDKSYEITEPGIYYQSAYLRLLSQLVPIPTLTPAALAFGPGFPASTVTGVSMAPPITVRVLDASGVLIPTSTIAVTIAIQTNPHGGTLSCGPATCTKPAEGGVATFDTLSINTVGTGYRLGATSGALTPGQSDLFAITAAPAAPTDLAINLFSTGGFLR